jgi:hypothetical protein
MTVPRLASVAQVGVSIEPLEQLVQQTPVSGATVCAVDSFMQVRTLWVLCSAVHIISDLPLIICIRVNTQAALFDCCVPATRVYLVPMESLHPLQLFSPYF